MSKVPFLFITLLSQRKWAIAWILLLSFYAHFSQCVWTGFDLISPKRSVFGKSFSKISPFKGNGPPISKGAQFGSAVANIGDIDGNGIEDIAVGAIGESCSYLDENFQVQRFPRAGAVYILMMGPKATVLEYKRIGCKTDNGPNLFSNDEFGFSLSSAGDLDGDGVNELAVGAPGIVVGSVYILYLSSNASVKQFSLIRGEFVTPKENFGNLTIIESNRTSGYKYNGPPIHFMSKFGSSLSYLGDFNRDGVPDIATSMQDGAYGETKLYLLFMFRNGSVRSYSTIGSNLGGGPDLGSYFSYFGGAVVTIGDFNGDNITDLAVGAKYMNDLGSSSYRSGVVFVFFMKSDGTVNAYTRISELGLDGNKMALPLKENDQCGASLTFVGDINKDHLRSQHPTKGLSKRGRPSVQDIVVGCPQEDSNRPGRIILYLLTNEGWLLDKILFPDPKTMYDPEIPIDSRFASALASYQDLNQIGLRGFVVGAPGDKDGGKEAGAVYVFFLDRNAYITPFHDPLPYILSISLPLGCFFISTIAGIFYFFWYYRRKPDAIEIMVKQSGVEITKERKRKKKDFQQDGKVYIDDYVL